MQMTVEAGNAWGNECCVIMFVIILKRCFLRRMLVKEALLDVGRIPTFKYRRGRHSRECGVKHGETCECRQLTLVSSFSGAC